MGIEYWFWRSTGSKPNKQTNTERQTSEDGINHGWKKSNERDIAEEYYPSTNAGRLCKNAMGWVRQMDTNILIPSRKW